MSLEDEIKAMKAELEEIEEKEEVIEEPPVDEAPKEEEAPVEVAKEEPKEEPKKEEELGNAGYARLRREAAAAEAKAARLERELEEARKAKEPVEQREEVALPPELTDVLESHKVTQAERAFQSFEAEVLAKHPEYADISQQYAKDLYRSLQIQNPRKSHAELNEMTKMSILRRAGDLYNQGFENPVEEMLHEAKELGYKVRAKEEPKEEKMAPDMDKVAKNRERSAGMVAASGKSEGQMTPAFAANLDPSEWGKMSKEAKAAIFRQLGQVG